MMKQILSTLLVSTALFVVADFSVAAWAQTSNDQTTQTDKSEEDWRKSRKKTTTDDIFEDILNRRSTGSGYGMGPENPMDSLPEESRRHLMKERAKVIATSDPGQTVTTPYTPSEAAKTDADLQAQEKGAWDKLVSDMNGGQGNNQGQGQAKDQGQGQSAGQTQGQSPDHAKSGTQSGSQSGQTGSSGQTNQAGQSDGDSHSSSPLRGGSSASVADILAKIKGMQSGSGGAPQGNPSGNQTSGPQGANQQSGNGEQSGKSPDDEQTVASAEGQTLGQPEARSPSQAQTLVVEPSPGAAQQAMQTSTSGESAATQSANLQTQSGSDTVAQAHAQSHEQSNDAAPQSPLDRIQSRKRDTSGLTSGKRSSASDYLKTSD